MIEEADCLLIDVRTEEEFAEFQYPNSINIPLNELKNHLQNFKLDTPIVVFCRSGIRSAEAKFFLEKNGFKKVCNGVSYKKLMVSF